MSLSVDGITRYYKLISEICDHRNAYGITSGWYCPDCGNIIPIALPPYSQQSTGRDIIYNNFRQTGSYIITLRNDRLNHV